MTNHAQRFIILEKNLRCPMSKKKKIVLTVVLGVLILGCIYTAYLNIQNIIYLANLTYRMGNVTEYKFMIDIWTQALYKNNTYFKSAIVLFFSLCNILFYSLIILKFWNKNINKD